MKISFLITLPCIFWGLASTGMSAGEETGLTPAAQKAAQKYTLVDTHIDVPYRLEESWADVTKSAEDGDFD